MSEIVIDTPVQKSVITCEEGCFAREAGALARGRESFLLTDNNVYALYREEIRERFPLTPIYVLPAGETSKNYNELFNILQAMIEAGLHRNAVLFALGGGVVGDIGGLAAALYMRGIHCVQIPTTLLAQVDSSVGGKTAVDMGKVKNVVGTFYQPERVLVDSTFLHTLLPREIRCGLGEIVKYGGLNGKILDKLTKNAGRLFDLDFLGEITADCIAHKAEVVRLDEKESGLRKSLNMGHTTGHALELCFGEKSHGEYVLIGMYYELMIARAENMISEEYENRLNNLILKVLGTVPVYDRVEEAVSCARLDKKNADSDEISLILPVAYNEYRELKLPYEKYLSYMKKFAQR